MVVKIRQDYVIVRVDAWVGLIFSADFHYVHYSLLGQI